MLRIFIFAALLLLFTTSCGQFARFMGSVTGWYRICIENVSYLQFTSGVTVEYTEDGKIKTCKS
jgi:hypothetical protein